MSTYSFTFGLVLLAAVAAGTANADTANTGQTTTASAPSVSATATVYLDTAASWARLHDQNPRHYARAELLVAAANRQCKPGVPAVQPTDGNSDRLERCEMLLLRTSNPPKRELTFVLDRTRYIAIVAITDDPPRAVPAG
jgi:hypothetical protein